MTFLIAILVGVAALASLATFAMSLGLGRSDAAGNGLAQAYVVIATLATTLLLVAALLIALTFAPLGSSPPTVTTLGLTALALAQPATTLPALFAARNGVGLRTMLAIFACLGQLACVLHAMSRALGVPGSTPMAVAGCAAVALLATLLPIPAWPRTRQDRPAGVFAIAFPALVLRPGRDVHVVRDLDELAALDAAIFTAMPAATTVDANAAAWTLIPAASLADWLATRAALPAAVADVQAQLLAMPSLHPDPQADARARQLVMMQHDIRALSFVVPRPHAGGD